MRKLLGGEEGEGQSCEITGMLASIRHIANGVKYFSVEVTCSDGAQYGIPAYGDEAEELYSVAMESAAREKVPRMTIMPR